MTRCNTISLAAQRAAVSLTSRRTRAITATITIAIASVASAAAFAQEVTPPESAPHPGDVVRMRIWREPDLSGEYTVNELGDVVLPKLGSMHVSDIPADSLRVRLVSSYAAFLRDPSIDVMVLRRVKVTGAVKNPGLYPADATMKLGDVVALAGGATPEGDSRKVRLSRAGESRTVELSLDQRLSDSPVRSGDQLEVMERSWYARNTGLLATTVSTAGFLIVTIIKR